VASPNSIGKLLHLIEKNNTDDRGACDRDMLAVDLSSEAIMPWSPQSYLCNKRPEEYLDSG